MKKCWLAIFLLFQVLAACAGTLVSGQPNSFVFTATGYFADKPVTVHYYKPKRVGPDAKVIIVIHGSDRSGKRMRDNWLPFAESHGLVVLAPEFDKATFSERQFNAGNIEEGDRARWTFRIVEELFESVRADENLAAPSYMLFGHSAGGQFVHRFMLMTQAPKVSVAIAANAGAYTMPSYPGLLGDRFPYALDERIVGTDQLARAFARPLVVLLGEADTSSDEVNLPKSRQAKGQGANRFERGQRFFAEAQAQAKKSGLPLEWTLTTVPGVGHSSRDMSKAASRLLFDSTR